MNKLIMPKQTAGFDRFIITLKILYDSASSGQVEVSNAKYKSEIINAIEHFTEDSDSAMLVKQSEIARYFGFATRDFKNNLNWITDTGIQFYEAYQNNDTSTMQQLITDAIINNSFGRNNTATGSDADIDPPKLFIKSILALDGVFSHEMAILVYLTNDLYYDFDTAILQVKNMRITNSDIDIKTDLANKYHDNKFMVFLTKSEIAYCELHSSKYYLSSDVNTEQFNGMSIYNTPQPNISIITEIRPEVKYLDNAIIEISNNRIPEVATNSSSRYKTDSRLRQNALANSEYKCEVDNKHVTFTSKSSKPYMEVHHLIPMSAQSNFEPNIDRIENLVSLCPNCHRAIHHGDNDTRYKILEKIYGSRQEQLNSVNLTISIKDLFDKYYQ